MLPEAPKNSLQEHLLIASQQKEDQAPIQAPIAEPKIAPVVSVSLHLLYPVYQQPDYSNCHDRKRAANPMHLCTCWLCPEINGKKKP